MPEVKGKECHFYGLNERSADRDREDRRENLGSRFLKYYELA
ncbi:hypothetical protein [Lusitaniella coriacea]